MKESVFNTGDTLLAGTGEEHPLRSCLEEPCSPTAPPGAGSNGRSKLCPGNLIPLSTLHVLYMLSARCPFKLEVDNPCKKECFDCMSFQGTHFTFDFLVIFSSTSCTIVTCIVPTRPPRSSSTGCLPTGDTPTEGVLP